MRSEIQLINQLSQSKIIKTIFEKNYYNFQKKKCQKILSLKKKITNNLSAKYYQKRLQKNSRKISQSFSKRENKKQQSSREQYKLSQIMKNKGQLSVEKKILQNMNKLKPPHK